MQYARLHDEMRRLPDQGIQRALESIVRLREASSRLESLASGGERFEHQSPRPAACVRLNEERPSRLNGDNLLLTQVA
jgi:hypothetical protein